MSTICKRARSIENPSPFSFSCPENFHTQKLLVTKIWCLFFRHAVKKYGPVTFHIMSGNLINVKCNFFSFNRRNCQLLAHFVSKWTDHLINKLSNKLQQMLWCNSTIMSLTFLMDLLGRSSYKGYENFVFCLRCGSEFS